MPTPGEVYRIKREHLPTDDPKTSRRYVLMTPVAAPHQRYGSVAYASGSEDAAAKSPCVAIDPRPAGADSNGFDEATLIFPGLLFPVSAPLLSNRAGRLNADEWAAVGAAVPTALGCGTGSCRPGASGAAEPGLRGLVVAFAPLIASRWSLLRYAVVLTPYPFSIQALEFQVVVPIYPRVTRVSAPDFVMPPTAWSEALGGDVCIAVTDTLLTKRTNHVPGPPNAACDTALMEHIDAALLTWLVVPQPGRSGSPASTASDGGHDAGGRRLTV